MNIDPKYFTIFIGIFLFFMIWTSIFPVITNRSPCNHDFPEKGKNDSLFKQIVFKGTVLETDIFRSAGGHGYHKVHLKPIVPLEYETANVDKLKFWKCKFPFGPCWIGIQDRSKYFISKGDTIEKKKGTYYYTIHRKNGDHIISELRFNGACRGDSCTYLPCP